MKATGLDGRARAPCRPARGRDLYNDVGADHTFYGIIRPVARTLAWRGRLPYRFSMLSFFDSIEKR
ncbi:hypothetical protein H4W81_002743 [Nonomuraea africana]|uniref:Uncharacterized protein n=1 Tax=Nonomuraea africana TaxID=46171 RepID=A0ABR9KD81_9ACTN|nr:hypothetical protein [Nonomuraea africana]